VYYFLRLFNVGTILDGTPRLSGVYVDSKGDKYPDNKQCFMSKCEDHTMDVINTYPMQDWQTEFPDADLSMLDSVTYSREELFILLWVPVLLLCFIGIVTLILHAMAGCDKAERVCNCCWTSCICCHLPIMLLFTAFFFVFVYALSDGCYDGPLVGESHLKDSICTGPFNGEGTVTDCVRSISIPDSMGGGNITMHMDIKGMYSGFLLGDCPKEDPFAAVIQQIADGVRGIPEAVTVKQVDKTDMRDELKNVTIHMAQNTGDLLHGFMYGVSENVLSCNRISKVFAVIQAETCESYTDPLVWIVAPWYFCTWILLCFALPSACMKKKESKRSAVVPVNNEEMLEAQEVASNKHEYPYEDPYGPNRDGEMRHSQGSNEGARSNHGDVEVDMQRSQEGAHMGPESTKMMRKLGSDFVQDPDEEAGSDV
jgi:hypothetical protein